MRELQTLLDEEVDRLPERLRAPFVLCCWEGRSRAEAAQQLGWKEGTLSSRLAQARARLQQRLARRGVTLTAALSACSLAAQESAAAGPGLTAISRAASAFASGRAPTTLPGHVVALAEEVLGSMSMSMVKLAMTLCVAAVLIGLGIGGIVYGTSMSERPEAAKPADEPVAKTMPRLDDQLDQGAGATDQYGDPLPAGVVRRFGTLRLRQCGPVVFSPDGKHIVTAGGAAGSDVVFWDRKTGKETRRLRADFSILRLQLSPDGKRLAAMLGTVFTNPVWDVASGRELFKFMGERGTFTSDGQYLFGVYHSNDLGGPVLGRWEVATGKQTGQWTMPAEARATCASPDGKTAAYCLGEAVVLYDLDKKAEKRRWPVKMRELAFGPDGKYLAAWQLRDLRLWAVANGQQEFAWDRLVDGAVNYSTDGKRLAWTGYDDRSIPYPWVVEIGQAQPRRLGLPINNLPSQLAFSPDGATLAVNTDARALELRDTVTGKDALPLDANTSRIFGLELSPDGRYLATFDQFRVLVWDKASGKLLRRFPEDEQAGKPNQPAALWDVRLAADGQLLRGNPNRLHGHWEEMGPTVARLQKLGLKDARGSPAFTNFEGTVLDVLESPGTRHVAVRVSAQRPGVIDRNAGKDIRIWDTRTGLPLSHVQPPDRALLGAFSPDNRLLATTAPQGTIQLWDLGTGRERLALTGHLAGAVRSLLFTPDHRFLFSGGDDSQVLQWDLTGRARDGVWRTVKHEPKQQLALWEQLAATDAAVAHNAVWELAADPAGTVAFLEGRLKPVSGPNPKEVADLIAELGSDDFARRQDAQARLARIGEPAVPAMRQALTGSLPLEQARRLEKLILEGAAPALTGDPLRSDRGIEILERIATPDARRLLRHLATGVAGTRFTQAAADSLGRLTNP